ncbi:general substrate transporter [Xylariaceae sp. FL1272]|nr:general substrate transporter [Xylariaceae sp. FL1272]
MSRLSNVLPDPASTSTPTPTPNTTTTTTTAPIVTPCITPGRRSRHGNHGNHGNHERHRPDRLDIVRSIRASDVFPSDHTQETAEAEIQVAMDDLDSPNARLLPDGTDHDAPLRARPGDARETTRLSAFVIAITLAAGICSLLAGYETGVTSAALVSIGSSLSGRPLTSLDKSLITSSTALCALITSPLASLLADRTGRTRAMLCADLLFIAGSLIQASSSTVANAVAGRAILGMATGLSSVAVPLYIAEIAPAQHRGRLIVATILLVTAGQALGFMVASSFAAWSASASAWRFTIALGALPAAIQACLVVSFMPDSPRWLVMVGRVADARHVLQRIHGSSDENRGEGEEAEDATALRTDALVRRIQSEARELHEARQLRQLRQPKTGYRFQWLGPWEELLSERRYRRALAIACLLQALQQLSGFNSLMYYSATIFKLVGFRSPTMASLLIAVINFIFTVTSLRLIDRVGRRRMLLISIPFMITGLLLAAFGFSALPAGVWSRSESPSVDPHAGASAGAVLVLVSIIVYVASFAVGLGNVPAMQSELYPLPVRSLGTGVATSLSWTGNFAMGLTFLPLMDALSPPWTFTLYAGVCTIGGFMVFRLYPEVAGLSLEEASALLDHGWLVR